MLRCVLAAAVLTLTACSSPAPLAPLADPVAARTPAPGHVEQDVNATVTMEVSGDVEFSLTEVAALLHVVEIFEGGAAQPLWFFSISSRQPVELDDGRIVLFSADLSPGLYRGPGTYELGEQSGITVQGQSGLGSGAYVQTIERTEDGAAEILRFDRFEEPCTLVVAEDARHGTVDCPSLLRDTSDDMSVGLSWSWQRETVDA